MSLLSGLKSLFNRPTHKHPKICPWCTAFSRLDAEDLRLDYIHRTVMQLEREIKDVQSQMNVKESENV